MNEYYNIGQPILGILLLRELNVAEAVVSGPFLNTKTGGIEQGKFAISDIAEKASASRVCDYRQRFIKNLLDF